MQLIISNICKSIQNHTILNKFSLSVASGEIAILLGKSGVGKSTILKILNNLEKPDSGKIALNNKNIYSYDDNQIGMVFQNFHLFSNLSVIENITLALIHVKKINKKEAFRIGSQLLEKYNLLEKMNATIESLSGGQKQKIAIIRTIATKPKIICFDEPISALDPYSTNEIITFIKELQKENYIIIMTTHNVYILNQLSCTIHLMHSGKIIESTTNTLFFKNQENTSKDTLLSKFIYGNLS